MCNDNWSIKGKPMSERLNRWRSFHIDMASHVARTVEKYGDEPDDRFSEMDFESHMSEVKKYLGRGRLKENTRDEDGCRLDIKKAVHHLCEAYLKFREE